MLSILLSKMSSCNCSISLIKVQGLSLLFSTYYFNTSYNRFVKRNLTSTYIELAMLSSHFSVYVWVSVVSNLRDVYSFVQLDFISLDRKKKLFFTVWHCFFKLRLQKILVLAIAYKKKPHHNLILDDSWKYMNKKSNLVHQTYSY